MTMYVRTYISVFCVKLQCWKLPLLLCSYVFMYVYIPTYDAYIYLCYLALKSLNSRSAQSWSISDMSFMVRKSNVCESHSTNKYKLMFCLLRTKCYVC